MKKIIAIFVFCIMLAGVVLPFAVSAADILWTDDFTTAAENDWIWDEGTTNFYVSNGKLEGWAEAVVHQSNFLIDRGAPRRYKECAWKIECAGLEDGGYDRESHALGIWMADYIDPYQQDEAQGQIVYTLFYGFEEHKLTFNVSFDGDAAQAYIPASYDPDKPLGEIVIPDADAADLNERGDDAFTLGFRIANGVVAAYYNDVKYFEINAFRGTTTCTERATPLLLFNSGCHCTFDNLMVTTPDYDLFNEGSNPAPVVTPTDSTPAGGDEPAVDEPAPTEKVIETKVETKVVEDTNEEGEIVTRIETEIVTEEVVRPAPETQGNTPSGGGTSARTGDTAIIVAAVMITALGAAIVVKKVSSK